MQPPAMPGCASWRFWKSFLSLMMLTSKRRRSSRSRWNGHWYLSACFHFFCCLPYFMYTSRWRKWLPPAGKWLTPTNGWRSWMMSFTFPMHNSRRPTTALPKTPIWRRSISAVIWTSARSIWKRWTITAGRWERLPLPEMWRNSTRTSSLLNS